MMNYDDRLSELNGLDIPQLDIAFLSNNDNGLGLENDNFDFENIDFNLDFDDLDFGSDGLQSSIVIDNLNTASSDSSNFVSRVLVDDVRVLESNGKNSGNFDCYGKNSGNFDGEERVMEVLSPESGDSGGERSVSGPASSHDSGGDRSVVEEVLSSDSPESGVVSGFASPSSCNVVVEVGYQEVKVEEEGKGGCVLKRKKDDEDDDHDDESLGGSNSSSSSNPRCSKVRKASVGDNVVAPEEDKKKARLMRNRESAQLSRQRKKHYVEELEDKVRSMAAVIADLNGRLSYFMSENTNLRQQLNGGNVPPQTGAYPPPAMAPMPYPWYPPGSYSMRTQGSQVPLVPIPRLKPKQPTSVSKNKKSDSKKTDSKVKKVSSVTFLGLLFFVFLFCGLVPLVNVRYGGKMDTGSSDFGFGTNGFHKQHRGRVLTVNDHLNDSHSGVEVGYHSGKSDLRECGANRINCRRAWVEGGDSKGKHGSQRRNSSEPLVASLYVPRNDKLVKIDGNLIIHSVLASEKAMASRTASEKKTVSPANESPETSLVVAGHPHMYRSSSVRQKTLNSGSSDNYKDRTRSPTSDGSLQKWFQEGLAGPILSSGMCTEVFQFDVSSSINPGAIIPASSVNISMVKNESQSAQPTKRNRRSLNHLPIPLPNEFNHSEEHSRIPPHKNKTVSSMVVSILADPREAGDIDMDGGISPKSLSKIFVVVLIDSVKYVTYSCMLPFKGASPSQLVTT
ncbi:hypothetical protein ACHQM5_018603 [Ranunculus cassubicifolius]